MRMRSVLSVLCAFALAISAKAQGPSSDATASGSRLNAKMDCPKLEPAKSFDVPDRPGHIMMISTAHCQYTEGEVAGEEFQTEDDTLTTDVIGNVGRDMGYGVITLAGDDKAFRS